MTDKSGVYPNNIYVAWLDNTVPNGGIVLTRSTDHGLSWSSRFTFPIGSDGAEGTNIAVGPNGEVYLAFANYPGGGRPESGIRFARSTNGGTTWSTAGLAFAISGIRVQDGPLVEFGKTRVNSFPSMGVDRSPGPRRGWIYIVYADRNTGDADIYLRRSTNQGTTWSSAIRVNGDIPGNGQQQWFPSLAVDPVTGDLCVSYYNMNGGGYSTTRYVAYSLDGGDSWIRQQISDVYFTPKPIADAGYMGDYYETAAYGGQSWVAWSDDRVGGVFQAFVDTVMIRWQLSVDQHLENGSSIDSVDHWQEATHFVRYRAPASIWFSDGHTEVIRGTQNILSNQKFHKWNIDDSVTNHRPFHLQAGLTELISELKPTLGDITVKAALFDAPGVPGGNIQFRDPWYIDFVDPLYGNTRRNRGMDSAVFYFRSSPFNPGYSNPFPEGSYKGVFLNENSNWLPDRPNYAVSAPSQQTIGGYSSYFLNWSAHPDSAAFQDPYNDTTAVVFKKPAAIATANPLVDPRRLKDACGRWISAGD